MNEIQNYDDAVEIIKTAILQSQYDAARSVNEKQLTLYYGIGKYISRNSREGFWGKGAIEAISEQLDKELPGLKGFSARNLRNMRTFYEEWSILDQEKLSSESGSTHVLADASAETEDTSTEDSEETDEDPKEIVEPATENASQEEITDSDAEAEAEETADETSPDKEDDPDTDVEETADEALHATAELDTLSISMPDDLTDTQRANLIKLVRSKETLLKHAFRTDSVEIHMEDEKLIFPWFSASDGDHTNAYILFLTKLISFAKEAKRVTGSDYPVENEKYAMRTWLLRLGMIGPEYKGCRKVLLENLSGNGAFRDGHKKSGAENSEEA